MSRKILVAAAVLGLAAASVFAQTAPAAPRSDADFVKQALQSFPIDSVGRTAIMADGMDAYYTYYPAMKGGQVVGYVWWGRGFKVAQHTEDLLLFVKVAGGKAVLGDYWISHNDHHANLGDPANHAKFVGMTYDTNWNEKADVISGSTLSTYRIVSEAKPVLFSFQKYVIDANLLK